jgi:hypothetical protein
LPIVNGGATKKIKVSQLTSSSTTNLTYTASPNNGIVNSSTGTNATLPLADGTNAGLFTPAEKTKLSGIQAGAEVNVNADWNATTGDAQILNKPTIPASQVNSDWNATTGVAQILNKPTIPDANTFVPYTGATAKVDLGEFELKAGQIELDLTPTKTAVVGGTQWNDDIGSTETTLKGGSVILKNGVDLVTRVVNKVQPNATLSKENYQVVRVASASGQRLAVNLAQANNDANSADTIGVVVENIDPNQQGFILTMGQLLDINTTGSKQGETWTEGDVLYLSPTTAGGMTNIKPNGSNGHIVVVGYLEYAHNSRGKIFVKIMNGWELDELHNVFINNPINNEVLAYETSTDLWKNKSVASLGFKRNIINEVSNIQNAQNLTQNIVFSQLIPANTFAVKDIMHLSVAFDKYGSAGTATVRGYVNAGNNISGAQLLFTFTSATTSRYLIIKRMFSVFSTTFTQGLLSTSSSVNDAAASTITSELYSFDITNPRWFIITIQQTNAGDTIYTNSINLTN